MKNLTIGLLLLATVVCGSLYLYQTHKATQAETTAGALQQKVSDLQSSVDEQDQQKTRLREQVEQARADTAAKIAEAAHIRETLQKGLATQGQNAAADSTGQTNLKPSNPLAEMFKNPEMKEMIKTQQKTALSAMIDKNYGKLLSDLHLTREQSASLKDLILNKQLAAADIGMSMFSGDQDPTNRAAMVQQVKTASDTADGQIKQLLGDDGFTQFQTYEKSIGERMALSGFKDQLGSGPTALSDGQEQQLIQVMTQERQNFKFTTDLSDKSSLTGDFATMFTEDKMNGYVQELGQLNQQYLARAQTILSPDQYTAFEKYLNTQQAMQKMGIQMAVKMFAPAKPAGN